MVLEVPAVVAVVVACNPGEHFAETLELALTAREVPEIANRIIMAAMLEAENLGLGAFAVDLAIEEPTPTLGSPVAGAATLEIEVG